MSEQILITEVNKIRRKKQKEQQAADEKEEEQKKSNTQDEIPASLHQEQFSESISSLPVLERDIIRILIEFGAWTIMNEEAEISVTKYVLEELEGLNIETAQYKTVYELVKREFAQGAVYDEKFFTANDDEKISSVAIQILAQPYSLSDNWWNKYKIVVPGKREIFQKDIISSILRLKQFRNIVELKKVENLLKETRDDADMMRLMKMHKALMEQKKDFARTVGNVVYRPVT